MFKEMFKNMFKDIFKSLQTFKKMFKKSLKHFLKVCVGRQACQDLYKHRADNDKTAQAIIRQSSHKTKKKIQHRNTSQHGRATDKDETAQIITQQSSHIAKK